MIETVKYLQMNIPSLTSWQIHFSIIIVIIVVVAWRILQKQPSLIRFIIKEITAYQRAETEQQNHKNRLEKLVAERTTELTAANEQLKREISHHEQADVALRDSEESLQQRNNELALLNHASRAFNSTLDLDIVMVTILEGVRYLMNVVGVTVWLINPDTNELVCQQSSGDGSEILCGWRLAPGQGVAGWTVEHNQSVIVADTRADKRHFQGIYQQIGLELRSILSVPLRVKARVIGVLQVVDAEINRFSAADLNLLEPLAATAAIAIENARLYKQAQKDAKTKAVLLNEVNHRVKNNLSAIIGLLYIEQHHVGIENQAIYQAIMDDLINRIQGLATVHQMLSRSEWSPLFLSELAEQIIKSALRGYNNQVTVEVFSSAVMVTADQANNLALVINELATNSIKYALSAGRIVKIIVRIEAKDDKIWLEFRDDGIGYPDKVLRLVSEKVSEQYNVGLFLIQTIVQDGLRGEISFRNDCGAVAAILFQNLGIKS